MMTADELAEKAIALRRKYKPLIEEAQANWRRARMLAEELRGIVGGERGSYEDPVHDATGFSEYAPFASKYHRQLQTEIYALIKEFLGESP
jgi:hypothetical protein